MATEKMINYFFSIFLFFDLTASFKTALKGKELLFSVFSFEESGIIGLGHWIKFCLIFVSFSLIKKSVSGLVSKTKSPITIKSMLSSGELIKSTFDSASFTKEREDFGCFLIWFYSIEIMLLAKIKLALVISFPNTIKKIIKYFFHSGIVL
jgi:hypothetical protein